MDEIERRFLVNTGPPPHPRLDSLRIWQGYLLITAEGSLRIRSINDARFTLSVKRVPSGSTLVRKEFEVELTQEQFNSLSEGVAFRPVVKVRNRYRLGAYLFEVDEFEDTLRGLRIVEVEFRSVEDALDFEVPDWFGREVTEDRRYLNTSLARYGLPSDEGVV